MKRPPFQEAVFLSSAGALGCHARAISVGFAFVGIGLAVAAADRRVFTRAERLDLRAGASNVRRVHAGAIVKFAEEAVLTLQTGYATTHLASGADRKGFDNFDRRVCRRRRTASRGEQK